MTYRIFEILPGLFAWLTISLVVILSWLVPTAVAIFIIVFDVYWLLKSIYLSLYLRSAFRELRQNIKIDWLKQLESLNKPWGQIYHLVIFPMYQEPYRVVRESLIALANAHYPKDKFVVVLATEGRGEEVGRAVAQKLRQEFGNAFFQFLVTNHPKGIPGELPGKGSNETWAAKIAKEKIIDQLGLKYENILVSVFDADTQILPEYFGILTHAFLTTAHPQNSSYQPVPLFTNNIFHAPAIARIFAFTSTFWHMIQQERPEQLTTFSSHSMPFKALVEVGFWNTNVVSEDSQIFWQCYLHYNGNWQVVPLFYPVSMDANVAPGLGKTMLNIYKQQRRWAWGAENIPYLLYGFLENKYIPAKQKIYWSFKKFEAFHSWATNAIIIFALGWLPIILGGKEFNLTLLSYNLPWVTRTIMVLAMLSITSSAIISIILLPPKPTWFRKQHYLLYVIQWFLMPLTLIIFGALPALEAQTRLMLGGRFRLGFWATPKYR